MYRRYTSSVVTNEPEKLLALYLKGRTLALAESCTGGLVASRIVSVPGSSGYFLGGVVAYSNNVKERLLGVPEEVLRQYGAVSAECALAMARRARHVLGADVGLSTTGIAGPAGGTLDKPVGLVYVAVVLEDREVCERFVWDGDRLGNISKSAEAALSLLIEQLAER